MSCASQSRAVARYVSGITVGRHARLERPPLAVQQLEASGTEFEIIRKNFQFSTRRARILMGFTLGTMLLPGTSRKSHGQNSSALTRFLK